ncbi:MAG: glycosyltransferase family 39 protein [Anaerolineae bacterium]|nr:glycosyltransferase family 39 protein [Anaerolineae bacterium]
MINWLEQHNKLILIIALFVGAGLRWLQISGSSFWYDEAFSVLIARLSPGQIWDNVVIASIHPPGYYLLLHFWLSLGQSEAAIRTLSALFSLGAIPLVYGLGCWLFNRATGALAALGLALCPFQVYFAQEARMYGLVVFLSVALTWIFLYAVTVKGKWFIWLGYILVAVLGLYAHYFFVFLLIGLHLWLLFDLTRLRSVIWRLVLADSLVALFFLPQVNQALNNTGAYLVGGRAWQTTPHLLSPLTTVFYLVFAHRSPVWLAPIGLFLTLAALLLIFWDGRRRARLERYNELALWFSLLAPIVIVLVISWLIKPIYLERSFAIASPALILLLARGVTAAPKGSPTPYLVIVLVFTFIITLAANVVTPDPAKPPIREAAQMVETGFMEGDVSLHLQDASCIPALWYTPEIPHWLADQGNDWALPEDHRLFGGDVVEWQTAVTGANRLWLTVMPGYNGPEQEAVHQAIEAAYPRLSVKDWGEIQLYLYNLRGVK